MTLSHLPCSTLMNALFLKAYQAVLFRAQGSNSFTGKPVCLTVSLYEDSIKKLMQYTRPAHPDHMTCPAKLCSENHGLNASYSRPVQDLYACALSRNLMPMIDLRDLILKVLKLFDVFSAPSQHLTTTQEVGEY